MFGLTQGESFSLIFDEADIQGSNFIVGIGPIFLYALGFPIYMIIHQLSRRFIGDKWRKLQNFNKVQSYVLLAVEFMLTCCFELAITALISMAKLSKSDFTSFWNFLSTILAIATIIGLLVSPFYIWKLARSYNDMETIDMTEEIKNKFKIIFEGKKRRDIYALNYPNFFLLRRYVVISVIIFLYDQKY